MLLAIWRGSFGSIVGMKLLLETVQEGMRTAVESSIWRSFTVKENREMKKS